MTTLIAIVGDLHVNSSVALCPPEPRRDDGQIIGPSKSQLWLWRKWKHFWATVDHWKTEMNAVVHAHINGDWVDKNSHSGHQLMSVNSATIKRWGVQAVQPLRDVADVIFVERGTEAHTGGSGELEEAAAYTIGAEPDIDSGNNSWYIFEGYAERVPYTVTHHPGTNSMRPWTAGGGANRAAAMMTYNYYAESFRPDFVIFNHAHHNEDSHDNHPVRAVFNRGWTLHNAYDHRGGRGPQKTTIGGIIVVVNDDKYTIHKITYELPRRKPWRAKT